MIQLWRHHTLLNFNLFFFSLWGHLKFPKKTSLTLVKRWNTPWNACNELRHDYGVSGETPHPIVNLQSSAFPELHRGTGKECTTSARSVPTWTAVGRFRLLISTVPIGPSKIVLFEVWTGEGGGVLVVDVYFTFKGSLSPDLLIIGGETFQARANS